MGQIQKSSAGSEGSKLADVPPAGLAVMSQFVDLLPNFVRWCRASFLDHLIRPRAATMETQGIVERGAIAVQRAEGLRKPTFFSTGFVGILELAPKKATEFPRNRCTNACE